MLQLLHPVPNMADKRKPDNPDIDVFHQRNFSAGIANFIKEDNNPYAYTYSQCIDTRTNPFGLTLLPATIKESGSVVTDLVKWFDVTPENLVTYAYDASGNLYTRTTAGSWNNVYTFANSHGNGLGYFYGDDYLYASCDSTIGRVGPIASGTPIYSSDFLTAQGGVPTNTASLILSSASSQYAHAANSGILDITSDLTLETYFKATTLPAIGASMTLLGKWDEALNHRSYKLDLFGVSGYFGAGTDGPLTISVDTTDAPIDSACTGSANTQSLAATNTGFAVGQVILIHQTQGTNVGQYERNVIQGYTAGTITLNTPLQGTYTVGAQVLVLHQYTDVTVNAGVTWIAKAWNGTTGGILSFLANGTVTINGSISATDRGFRGGADGASGTPHNAVAGEGRFGVGTNSNAANDIGGGGASSNGIVGAGGGGGSHATIGAYGGTTPTSTAGVGATTISDSSDLTTMTFGGGGGSGGSVSGEGAEGGANGGGIVFITGATITVAGSGIIISDGGPGNVQTNAGSSGGGAGGSILLKAQVATLLNSCQAIGGAGGISTHGANGGSGGDGYIVLNYYTSYTATTQPALNAIQDNTLVTTTTIQARLGISNNGTSFEYLTQDIPNITVGVWNRISVSWAAATSMASFYLSGVFLGTSTGTKTSISNNASLLTVGANNGGSGIANYFDGKLNDMRIIAAQQTAGQIFANCFVQLSPTYANLAAYYTFNSAYTDTTANANTLTPVNSPVFDPTDVPFPAPTTRLDIDQQNSATGSTYALKAAISEATADKLPFTPSFDPQKSVDFNISAVGTSAITVTVHDQQNRVIASVTVPLASLPASGIYEFVYSNLWRIVINKSYHIHVTQPTADGTLVSSNSNNIATADFHTYYGFLVTDTQFHPIARMLNFIVFGNERYLSTWDGAFYQPNLIAFPPGTHVRCFGSWGAYLAVGTWQEPTTGIPSIFNFPTGKIYFWDGISLTFNFYIDVPEGQVNAIFGMDADLYYIAGYKADLMYYHGSFANQSGSFNGTKVKRIPYLERSSYIDTFPQAICMYQGLLYFGMGGNSDSVAFPRNIYSWGTMYPQYAQSLSSDYIISTGNNGSTVKIGAVYPIDKKLLVSWQDGLAFGVDVIDPAGPLYKSGYIQTLTQDGGAMWRQDLLTKARADFLTLTGAQNVIIGQQFDRSGIFDASHSGVDTTKRFTADPLENGRCYEYSLQTTLIGDGTSSPTLLSITGVTNPLDSEDQI